MNNVTVFNDGLKWSKVNTPLAIAVISEYKLGGIQLAILLYIIDNYNRDVFSYKQQKGCKVSYTELAHKCSCPTITAKKNIQTLLEKKLIICANSEERKGRKSYCYVPNVEKLNGMLEDYLQAHPEDKNNE